MGTFDLTPLYRSSVGFEQLANLVDQVLTKDAGRAGYPPYNIEKVSQDAWRISIAVAGFSEDELDVEMHNDALIVSAKKAAPGEDKTYLHRGIATRAFERRFHLANHVRATGASHVNGMLHIDLSREVPEALKPRKIEIASVDDEQSSAAEPKALN